ncbi:MAG: hypothetical protein IID41_18135 [Planctomycetes bacterium]|nr:hypothetical protein [Planctomycetota bacterium]
MRYLLTAALACLAFTGASAGCANENQMETTLQALERGKAQGQLILTSDGRVSVDQQVSFGFGARGATLAFSGKIDFSDKLNRPVPEIPVGKDEPEGKESEGD